jgi:hypothetical protein
MAKKLIPPPNDKLGSSNGSSREGDILEDTSR